MSFEARLSELGIVLPHTSPPLASYRPVMLSGNLAFISGQLPFLDGELVKGTLGENVEPDRAIAAARACGLMILAQLRGEIGSLDRVVQVIKLGGFVACSPAFTDQHVIVNGASDLMAEVFGDAGRHARAAVGVPALPLGAAVEVDAVIEIAR